MTEILDKIIEVHRNPKSFVFGDVFSDQDLNMKILGRHVQEDDKGWFIKHDGLTLLYCSKHSRSHPEKDGPQNLEAVLAEMWGRYTKKKMHPDINTGFIA